MADLVQQAEAALEVKPSRVVFIAPGAQVAWDDCCDGQLWARVVSIVPSGSSTRGASPCVTPTFLATLELGIIRCAAVMGTKGQAPTAEAITLDGLLGLSDMTALAETLNCNPSVRTMEKWTPAGPQGGCFGGSWTLTATLTNCLTCPPEVTP